MNFIRSNLPRVLSTLITVCATTAHAQSLDDIVSTQILPGWRTDDGTHIAAIQVDLAPGWKTYWRAPGEAGIPPRFDWSGSQNISAVEIMWPRPEVFETSGMTTIGYHDQLILPIALRPTQSGEDIRLSARVDIGVCENICIPFDFTVSAQLNADQNRRDTAITTALANQPQSASQARVGEVLCDIAPIRDGLRLSVDVNVPRLSQNELAVVELSDQTIWVSSATSQRHGRILTAEVEMVPPNAQPFALDRSDVRITLLGGDTAINIEGCQGR